jgi:hypothetical protein
MEKLDIEATDNSPKVILDPFSLRFEISGESRPENAGKFYEKITQWLEQFQTMHFWQQNKDTNPPMLTFTFKLEYFNSTSAKYLLDVLKFISLCREDGCKVTINWYYDSRDEDMKESGEEFSQLVEIPFEYIQS